jgi:hypothetical protein
MQRLYLVDIVADNGGIHYQASEEAYSFVKLMRTPYARAMKERAIWLAENVCTMDTARIKALVDDKIGRWEVEFRSVDRPPRRL